jgi:hypothetical protein
MGTTVDKGLGAIGRVAGIAGVAMAAIGLLQAAVEHFNPPIEIATADTQKLAASLEELGRSGESAGEFKKVFGDLDGVIADMLALEPAVSGFAHELLYTMEIVDESGGLALGRWLTADDPGGKLEAMQAAFKQAQQNIEDLDAALAGMVTSGHAEGAALAATRLYDAWTDAGGTAEEFRDKFPEVMSAMEAYSLASQTTVDDSGAIRDGFGEAAAASDVLKGALDELNGVAMSNAKANINWTETLHGVKIAAEDGSASLDLNTLAGAQNADQFVTAAEKASTFAQTIADTQGIDAGRAAVERLRGELLDQAEAAGFDRAAVEKLINQIFKVPADTDTAINLHDKATPGIKSINEFLDRTDGRVATTTVVNTTVNRIVSQLVHARPYYETSSGGLPGLPNVPREQGGLVGVPAYAGGGSPIPGLALVGERGPELVSFGRQGYVTPADLTAQALAAAGRTLAGSAPPMPAGSGPSHVDNSRHYQIEVRNAGLPLSPRQIFDAARDHDWLHGV